MPSKSKLTVLVTGATSGIGKQTAKIFLKKGYRVIMTGRREELLSHFAQKYKKKYESDIYTLSFDISQSNDCEEAIASLPDLWQDIDILVNNAGGARGLESIADGKYEHWDYMMDTNVKGLLYITKIIVNKMIARGKGHIINVSSIAGHETYANGGVYCASKHAVTALTKAMRYDFFKNGIRVSQVSPGLVEDTEFSLNRFEGNKERANIYQDVTPLNAKDIADLIYFIASRSAHINIQDIIVLPTQQAAATTLDRSGRIYDKADEDDQ